MQHPGALGIDVAAWSLAFRVVEVEFVLRELLARRDRVAGLDAEIGLVHACVECGVAHDLPRVLGLHECAEALVQPHVRHRLVGHQVAEPLVRELVMEQPVEAVVVALEFVAVGIDGLMLHAEVRRLGNAEFLVAPGIRPELALEERNHVEELRVEQLARFRLVVLDRPEHHRYAHAVDRLVFAFDEHIGRDVERDAVGVDRHVALPVERAPAIAGIVHAGQDSVRRRGQFLRDREVQVDAGRLAARVILAREPEVAALALHRRRNPGLARGRLRPDETAVPGRFRRDARFAVVSNRQRGALARRDRVPQADMELRFVAPVVEGSARIRDGIHFHQTVEIEFQDRQRRQRGVADFDAAGDGLPLRVDLVPEHIAIDPVGLHRRRQGYAAVGRQLAAFGGRTGGQPGQRNEHHDRGAGSVHESSVPAETRRAPVIATGSVSSWPRK